MHTILSYSNQKKLKVWISTNPWQLGQFVAYDLKEVFALSGLKQNHEIADSTLNVKPDSFLLTNDYNRFTTFWKYKQRLADKEDVPIDSLIASNPEYFHTYVLAGDYSFRIKNYKAALHYYEIARTKVIATKKEEDHIVKQIARTKEKLDIE